MQKKCKNCGHLWIDEESRNLFCPRCGTKGKNLSTECNLADNERNELLEMIIKVNRKNTEPIMHDDLEYQEG